jgi:hypothetical protein
LFNLKLILLYLGTHSEGVFRLAGNRLEVRKLFYQLVVEGDLAIPETTDVNVVAGVAKLLLRRLPETILTNRLAPKFELNSCAADGTLYCVNSSITKLYVKITYTFRGGNNQPNAESSTRQQRASRETYVSVYVGSRQSK